MSTKETSPPKHIFSKIELVNNIDLLISFLFFTRNLSREKTSE